MLCCLVACIKATEQQTAMIPHPSGRWRQYVSPNSIRLQDDTTNRQTTVSVSIMPYTVRCYNETQIQALGSYTSSNDQPSDRGCRKELTNAVQGLGLVLFSSRTSQRIGDQNHSVTSQRSAPHHVTRHFLITFFLTPRSV